MSNKESNNFTSTEAAGNTKQYKKPTTSSLFPFVNDPLFDDIKSPNSKPRESPTKKPIFADVAASSMGGPEGQRVLQPKPVPPEPESASKQAPSVDTLQLAYDAFTKTGGRRGLDAVLEAARPTISKAITTFGEPGPLMQSRARLIAAKAVKTFSPTKDANLKSWLVTNLQELQRYKRKLSPVTVAERTAIEANRLDSCMKDLREDLGREPTTEELADYAHISPKRIRHIRKTTGVVANESQLLDEEGENYLPGVPDNHPDQLWAELVYSDLDATNRRIYDMLVRRKTPAAVQDVAKTLGISASAVSQRAARIARMLEEGSTYAGSY